MGARSVIEQADDLVAWAACIVVAVRFPDALEGAFVDCDTRAMRVFSSGVLGILQAVEHLDGSQRSEYERRLDSFVKGLGVNGTSFAKIAFWLANAQTTDEAEESKAWLANSLSVASRFERFFLLLSLKRFSARQRPALLHVARLTLEELRAFHSANQHELGEHLIVGTIVHLEKRISDEDNGGEAGGSVLASPPDGPNPTSPLAAAISS